MLQLLERKQNLLLKIRAAITLDRMDLVKDLSYELQMLITNENKFFKNETKEFKAG